MQYPIQIIKDPKQRIAICHECDKFVRMTTTCTLCGCFMIAKVQFENVRCPQLKW